MRLIPISVGTSVGSLIAGIIMNKTGKYGILGLALIFAFALGTGLLALVDLDSPE
jgi:hypothetical protein